ncbi:hemagglutinin repeat-containing protein [Budvicia diplopodorum]|uniref:hemagglutinin repeat-containing protein n=1 Tax=Budvicia diplopodorum TaxID=1119056 RepID=UPI001359E2C3|nr:hemagglutinin repeat-containing protein [Budvicia diplopodorum]
MKNNTTALPVNTSKRLLSYLISGLIAVQPVLPTFAAGVNVASGNTTTEQAANGVPVVNIATPNQQGVSHNKYNEFNVGKEGLILNNATGALNQTQLSGIIQNNPNLQAGHEAKAIINEVVGANRSQLQGYTEVAGKQANVMVANPYGITCDGCGFINTPNVTLTTGKPVMDAQGNLDSLSVTQGTITINGQGLDASQSSSVAIISRATEINAGLHAQDLTVIAGSNRVGSDGSVTPIAATESAPRIAVDTGSLGGMYANRIHLVSSEAGVGVNLGNLNARQGDVQLDVNGKLTLNNTLAQGNITANADELALSGNHKATGDIRLNSKGNTEVKQGVISSGSNVTLNSQGQLTVSDSVVAAGVDAQGTVGNNGTLQLEAANQQWNNSQLSAAQVTAKSHQAIQQDGASRVLGTSGVSLTGSQLYLDGQVSAGQDIALDAGYLHIGAQSNVSAQQNLSLRASNGLDNLGEINSGYFTSLSAGQLNNQGLIATNGNSVITATGINNSGRIQSLGSQSITAGTMNSSGTLLSGGLFTLIGDEVSLSGSVGSQQELRLTANDWLNVEQTGSLLSDGSLSLQANSADIAGLIHAQQAMSLTTQTLTTAQGSRLLSDEHIALIASSMTLGGLVSSSGSLSIDSPLFTSLATAQIQAFDDLSLSASQNAQLQGVFTAGGDLTLTGTAITQQGILKSDGDLLLTGTTVNQQGTLQGDTVELNAQTLTNSGTVLALDQLTVNAQQVDNQSGGKLFSAGNLDLTSNSLSNSGQIVALSDIDVRLQQDFQHYGTIAAGNALSLSSVGAITQYGTLQGDEVSVSSGGAFTNQGQVTAGDGTLSVNAANINLTSDSHLQSGGDIALTSRDSITHQGFTGAGGDLLLSAANNITNSSLLYAAGDMYLFANRISNIKGDILAGNSLWMQKDAAGNANAEVVNRSGTIETIDGDIEINTAQFTNSYLSFDMQRTTTPPGGSSGSSFLNPAVTEGHYEFRVDAQGEYLMVRKYVGRDPQPEYRYQVGGSETITVNKTGNAGRIASGRNLNIAATTLDNQASILLANRDITLTGTNLNNQSYQTGTSVVEQVYTLDTSGRRYVWGAYEYAGYRLTDVNDGTAVGPVYQSVIQASGDVYAYFDNDISNTTAVANAGHISHTLDVPTLSGQTDITLPDGLNGLFVTNPDPDSPYLITTNPRLNGLGGLDNGLFNDLYALLGRQPGSAPRETDSRFTDKNKYLGSAYFLDSLGLNPDLKYRFLGDAAFDTRYISDALIKQTGSRYINGIGSDLAQMQYLIDNAVDAQAGLNLTFGISLTLEQVAQLNKSIVWWEPVTVNGQTVLAPKLYLAKNDVTSLEGSVIKGNYVELDGGRVINSHSTILADKSLFIDSWSTIDNINSGQIKAGGYLSMSSMGDINNIGSTIRGQQVELESIDGSIVNQTQSHLWQTTQSTFTTVGDIASIQSEGSLDLTAGKDITLHASEVSAEKGNLTLSAGRDVNIEVAELSRTIHGKKNIMESEGALSSSLQSGENLTIAAGRDINAQAAAISADDNVALVAGRDVNLTTAQSREYEETRGKRKLQIDESIRQQGTEITAGDKVQIVAGHDISMAAADVRAEGDLKLYAGNDINISTATESDYHLFEETKVKKKTFSKTTTYKLDETYATDEKGTLLSGDNVTLNAGHDLFIQGSSVAGTHDVSLAAGNNLTVTTAEEVSNETHINKTTKSGLMGTGGIGVTVGKKSQKVTDEGTSLSSAGSTIGSIEGNVTMKAGENLTVQGSDVIAGKDINLNGKNVDILAAQNQSIQTHTVEQKQSGLTLALSGAVGSAVNTAVTQAKAANDEKDGRLSALQGMQAALSGVQAVQAGQMSMADANDTNMIGISVSYGSQSSKSKQQSEQRESQGSALTAGGNLNINATGKDADQNGNIYIQGGQLQAGQDINLHATQDVILESAANTQRLDGKNSSSGGSVGVGIGVGQGGWGISVSASVNKGKGHEKGNGTTHNETTLNAGDNVSIISGRDTTLTGAVVSGESITADVGRNLTMTSEQDSDRYDAKQQNASVGGSFTFGSMTGSLSVNVSQDKMHSNYDSVQEQTGFFAGKGGFDVTVGEHTQLNGAVIGSTATADKNRLDTGTLGFSDIENKADYKVEHVGVGISTGGNIGGQFVGNMANGILAGMNGEGHADSLTKSAISEGTIVIRDTEHQQQNIDDLSRDVEHANQTLSPIFDKEKEQNRLREAQLIGEIGSQMGDIVRTQGQIMATEAANEKMKNVREEDRQAAREALAKNGKTEPTPEDIERQVYNTFYNKAFSESGYGTGGKIQMAVQAATAVAQGMAGGNMAQAIAGGLNPYVAGVIKDMTKNPDKTTNEEANAMAHAVWGAVAAYASGNSALAGAAGAASGELMAGYLAKALYPEVKDPKDLSESQKQTIAALSTVAAGLAGGVVGDSSANAIAGAQAGKNAVENNLFSLDLYNLDRKVKDAKAKGEDITPILDEYRQLAADDRAKSEESCKANPDFCGFGRAPTNEAYNEIISNGVYLAFDKDVMDFVAQETSKDNGVINQYTTAYGEGLVLAADGVAILAGAGTSILIPKSKTTNIATGFIGNPQYIWGRSVNSIVNDFNVAGYQVNVRQSSRGSAQATIIEVRGHPTINQIQVHPGGGRHEGSYYKVSTTTQGIIKVVDPSTYKPIQGEKAKLIDKPGK